MLDIKDKRILHELCADSRQPSSAIAKKVGLSREVVEYRIKRLEREGIINGFITLINVNSFGYNGYTIFLLMQNFTGEQEKEIISYLSSHPAVRWMVTTIGKWDIIVRVSARNEIHFDGIMGEIFSKLGDNLRAFEIITSISRLKSVTPMDLFFKRGLQKMEKKHISPPDVDAVDIKILRAINQDSRKSLVELSKIVRLTPEAVRYRMDSLEKKGIIQGYSCVIDLSKMDYAWYILLFTLTPLGKSDENTIAAMISQDNKIWFCDKTLGKWNLHLELLAESTQDFHKRLLELRGRLGPKLHSFELLLVSKEHVNNRFPEMIKKELILGFQ